LAKDQGGFLDLNLMKKGASREPRKLRPWTDLSDFKNIHQGEKCFICGAGPSTGFLNLEPISNQVIIAVNSSILLLPWDKGASERRYWISNDVLCMQWDYFWKKVLRSNCQKIVRTSWKEYYKKVKDHNFRFFAARKLSDSLSLDGKLCGTSSVPTAIDFAIWMGCKDIYLLGVDHRMLHGNSHFWQFWPKKKWPQRREKGLNFRPEQKHQLEVFEQNKVVFAALRKFGEELGVNIYNTSSVSQISVFDKVSVEEALR